MGFEAFLGGSLLIGIVASCWSYLRLFASKFISLFIVTVKVEDALVGAVSAYLRDNFRASPFGLIRYIASFQFVKPADRIIMVGLEKFSDEPRFMWCGFSCILVALRDANNAKDTNDSRVGMTLSFVRGTFDSERLINAAIEKRNRRDLEDAVPDADPTRVDAAVRTDRFGIYRYCGESGSPASRGQLSATGQARLTRVMETSDADVVLTGRLLHWSPADVGRAVATPFRGLEFPPDVLALYEDAARWLCSKKWYRERNIPWRRGWLLYGRPGTGKTSFVRATAQRLNLPIFAFDLAGFSNGEFSTLWETLQSNSPCVFLIEDIDAVFDGRVNTVGERGGGLTFDCLLNCISGIKYAEGVLLVITTNHVQKLDAALGVPLAETETLSTRPGRIDRAVHFGPMDEAGKRRLADLILAGCPHLVDAILKQGCNDTGAQFQERCAQVALEHYWNKEKPCPPSPG